MGGIKKLVKIGAIGGATIGAVKLLQSTAGSRNKSHTQSSCNRQPPQSAPDTGSRHDVREVHYYHHGVSGQHSNANYGGGEISAPYQIPQSNPAYGTSSVDKRAAATSEHSQAMTNLILNKMKITGKEAAAENDEASLRHLMNSFSRCARGYINVFEMQLILREMFRDYNDPSLNAFGAFLVNKYGTEQPWSNGSPLLRDEEAIPICLSQKDKVRQFYISDTDRNNYIDVRELEYFYNSIGFPIEHDVLTAHFIKMGRYGLSLLEWINLSLKIDCYRGIMMQNGIQSSSDFTSRTSNPYSITSDERFEIGFDDYFRIINL